MAMDQQRRVAYRWGLVAESGYCGHRLTPRAGEPTWVTEAFLVDPADAGQGAVDARVEIGRRDLLLASLSAQRPRVVLQTPLLLDEEFCFYVTPQGGDSVSDTDADTDTGDGVAVYFRGIVHALASPDTEGEEQEDEEAVSSEDDDDEENHEEESQGKDTKDDEGTASTDDEDKENGGEVGGRAATASGIGGNVLLRRRNLVQEAEGRSLGVPAPRFAVRTEHVPPVAAGAFSGIFAIIYLLTFLILVMY